MIGMQPAPDVQIPEGFLSIFRPDTPVLPFEDCPEPGVDVTWVSVGEAARIVGVHPNTIRNWGNRGLLRVARLPVGRHRRFALEDVRSLAESIVATLAPAETSPPKELPDAVLESLRRQVPYRG